MKSNFFIRSFIIPLIAFAILGATVHFGFVPKSFYLPAMIGIIVLFSFTNFKQRKQAEQSAKAAELIDTRKDS